MAKLIYRFLQNVRTKSYGPQEYRLRHLQSVFCVEILVNLVLSHGLLGVWLLIIRDVRGKPAVSPLRGIIIG